MLEYIYQTIIGFLITIIVKDFLYVLFKILTRTKERYYKDFTKEELTSGYNFMKEQIKLNVSNVAYKKRLNNLLDLRWKEFELGLFSVDGATFIKEQYGNYFNLWWFNHDARNHFGYVGKTIDSEMLDIMILLNVSQEHFRESIWWFRFTWVNWIRHFWNKIFKKGNLKLNELPNDLVKLN